MRSCLVFSIGIIAFKDWIVFSNCQLEQEIHGCLTNEWNERLTDEFTLACNQEQSRKQAVVETLDSSQPVFAQMLPHPLCTEGQQMTFTFAER